MTSFSGPVAHLGYFYEVYIRRRKWMDEKSYADLVALCQFIPCPASSQVGIGIGVMRAGVLGGIFSFIGFTLPSVLVLILFASLLHTFGIANVGWIHGLKIVAVVVVAHAILGMAKNLTPDLKRRALALFALVITLMWQTVFTQIGVILMAAIIGYLCIETNIRKNIRLFILSLMRHFLCSSTAFYIKFFIGRKSYLAIRCTS